MNPAPAIAAAQQGDVLTFALTIAGILIFILSSLMWWMIKERIKSRERETALLDRRLSSGVERFNEMEKRIEQSKDIVEHVIGEYVHNDRFEKYCLEHKDEHMRFERKIEQLNIGQHEVKSELVGLNEKVDSGFNRLTGLLARIVKIENQEGLGND